MTGDCDTLGDILKAWVFTYDGDGVKVKQVYTDSNGNLTTYYYMGGSYELQTDGSAETVRQYYALAGVTAGMREGNTFNYFLTDHLGSVVGVTDSTGAMVSTTRYSPFGDIRTDVGTVSQTDYGYTFQRNVAGMGLMDYRARYYSTLLGRFVQPDSIIPGAGNPQAFNRYAYTTNNPINFNDPSGHEAIPIDDFIREVIQLIQSLGYAVIGNPTAKSPNANGADIVAVLKNGDQVIDTLAVEMKNVVGNVDLGTLGKSNGILRDYGGSIDRVLRSANRFLKSSNEQLRMESKAIADAYYSGSLHNILVTTGDKVSSNAQKVFDGVYTGVKNGATTVVKALPAVLSASGKIITNITSQLPQLILLPLPLSVINPTTNSILPNTLTQ